MMLKVSLVHIGTKTLFGRVFIQLRPGKYCEIRVDFDARKRSAETDASKKINEKCASRSLNHFSDSTQVNITIIFTAYYYRL